MTLRGIIPILITPFDANGQIDEASLRRVTRFELDGQPDGLGVGGFASEAYKLTEAERLRCAEIVADEVNGQVPLIIGMAAASTEAAIQQARQYVSLHPAALMTLPPNTMAHDEQAWGDFYVDFANAVDVPVMVQQAPQIQAYTHTVISPKALAQIAERTPNVQYFKIEGQGSAERIQMLRMLIGDRANLFGGGGGISLSEELRVGAAGLLPGTGFNEYFMRVWAVWEKGDYRGATAILREVQPLVEAVSSRGHEFSLHARKRMFKRAGIITHDYVRRPTVIPDQNALAVLDELVGKMDLRLNREGAKR
jgi:4-hydroxy-tetrahydrodipicolinate synthase